MNKIILSHDLEGELHEQCALLEREFVRVFECDEFKIADAQALITEAYITSHQKKTIFAVANSFNFIAQNALLKILEEPPRNTEFVLIAKNKNVFLSTVRSRLQIEDKRQKVEIEPFGLNLKQMRLADIYDFLKTLAEGSPSREETKQQIQSLLFSVKEAGIAFSQEELESFDGAILANASHQRQEYILLPLLLMVLQKKRG